MNKTKPFSFAALAGLFLIGTLMPSPHSQANGAVYSTPVSVVNTTANPGSVLDANTATRVPYQATASAVCIGSPTICTVTFPTVPFHVRLVAEYVGGVVSGSPGTTTGQLSQNLAFGGSATWATTVASVPAGPGGGAIFGQSIRAYIDPGTPTFGVYMGGSNGNANITLTGYLQDCTVSPCPAQQN